MSAATVEDRLFRLEAALSGLAVMWAMGLESPAREKVSRDIFELLFNCPDCEANAEDNPIYQMWLMTKADAERKHAH